MYFDRPHLRTNELTQAQVDAEREAGFSEAFSGLGVGTPGILGGTLGQESGTGPGTMACCQRSIDMDEGCESTPGLSAEVTERGRQDCKEVPAIRRDRALEGSRA